MRVEDGIGADGHPPADVGMRIDEGTLTDLTSLLDDGEGSDIYLCPELYALCDVCLGRYTREARGLLCLDELHELGEGGIGILDSDQGRGDGLSGDEVLPDE